MDRDGSSLVFQALADPTRRRLLDLLKQRPRTTGDLAARFRRLSRFGVMKHLAVLERARLVVSRRRGREVWKHLNVVPLHRACERWISPYESLWASSLSALKRLSESQEGEKSMERESKPPELVSIHIEQEVLIEAPRERVFDALTRHISAWWGAPYLIDNRATAIRLEPRLGGRLVELWGEEEGGIWATVTRFRRNQRLDLTGPIGMSGAVVGIATLELETRGRATVLKLTHRAIGQVTDETRRSYSAGWSDLLATRLKAFVEQGTRTGIDRAA
jgi:DNA-binding transcriptional ArsR family regulator/uncharacterized protein YndB with AHSA1/START domain